MKIYIYLLIFTINIFANVTEFEEYISKEIADKTPPSVSFAILKGDKIVYTKSMGYNDANMSQKTTTQSVYHVYSLTKILASTLVMQLIEERQIGLNDSIKKYFPNFDLRYDGKEVDITILNLLNHSSGIGDRSSEVKDMMGSQKSDSYLELPYMPGSEAKYSNAEYIILSKVIEQVTNRRFDELIKEYILEPTEMRRSDFTYNKSMAKEQVYGTIQFFSLAGTVMRFMIEDEDQDFYEGCMLWLKEFDIEWQAAGGLVSSIEDMAKFLSAYHGNRLFSKETKDIFINNKTVKVDSWMSSQEEVSFGIGWYHIHDKGKFFYQHQGLGPGFRTIMRIYPELDTSIIILTSQTSIDIDDWADRLIENIITEGKNEKKSI
ncbi:beta-lactamase family protein [Sulfurovum sp. bin170]|uniref:serine hydrolase domain-containing protein n=1 Tax=Sulfurovum sp. bin170 TaxID=2695268 RepID=UPI0013E00941|nr:serine hydrolase domain-containing protein [Sulfurovum sp. bin170]NEW59749.1 beta-lactamase family protein [Sulfurovum sp. bin170]